MNSGLELAQSVRWSMTHCSPYRCAQLSRQGFLPRCGAFLPQSWSALNIANLTWSFAKLAVRHQDLFSAVETWPRLGEWS